MITKERLEQTIRGVIREFRQANRIPDPTATELAAALEERVEDLFEQESTEFSHKEAEDSTSYVNRLRDDAQRESAEVFLQEIMAWQQMRS